MATTQLPETVRQALGPAAARDLVAWLEERFHTSEVAISAFVARQKVNVLMLEQVSNLLLADEPELIQRADRAWAWRVPIDLTYPSVGRVGRVGEIEVDAQYGEIHYTEAALNQIRANAQQLASKTTHTAS